MIRTSGGVELYTRDEAIAIGEEDPGEGNELIAWRDKDGDIISTSSCLAGTMKEGGISYSTQPEQAQQSGAEQSPAPACK